MPEQKPIELSLHSVDNSECRVYFTSPTATLYCFQLAKRGEFEMYQCTDEGEPLTTVEMDRFEPPFVEGQDSTIPIARDYNDWLGDLVLDCGHSTTVSY